MKPRSVLVALFALYVVATAIHIGWVLAHEPFSFDAWNVTVDTNAEPFSVGNFLEYWWGQYTRSNPRLGQPLTYLSYKLHYIGEVVLALSYLAASLAITVLAIGRWPWGRARDLALWAIAIGFSWFALPEIGGNLFCRAYGMNYVFTAALQLWFLVPLRLARSHESTLPKLVAYGFLGLLAGLCNEHTAPTMIAMLGVYAWWLWRAGERPRLVIIGAAGLVVGFLALFFAPGQNYRYDGLADQVSLPMRVIQRGFDGNLEILRDYVVYGAPVLVAIVAVLLVASLRPSSSDPGARTTALRLVAIAVVAGTLMTMTMFVSPKLGSRFFIVPMGLLLAGFLAVLDVVAVRSRLLVPFVAIAVFASSYAAFRTMPLFHKVSAQGELRMAELAATPPGGTYVADAWQQIDEDWWFIGDDFRDVRKREMVARHFGLLRVYFRGYDRSAPLGMRGIRIAPRYWTRGASCAEEFDGFDFGAALGFDFKALHRATAASIAVLDGQLDEPLERFEVAIEFVGARPQLPREKLLLSRWTNGTLEGYAGRLVRKPPGRMRVVHVPPELDGFEIYVTQAGGEVRKLGIAGQGTLTYEPWRKGVYWALACDADACFVFAAGRA